MLEMHESAFDVVDLERAAHTALFPAGAKHKMLDDQLAASAEEVDEGFLPVRPVKQVGLLDFDPRQSAPLDSELIAQPGQFLFPG